MDHASADKLRALPSVDQVLSTLMAAAPHDLPHDRATDVVRKEIDSRRTRLLAGEDCSTDIESITAQALARLRKQDRASLRTVVNATGVVIHTNLGRSPLPDAAIDAVVEAARGYSTLEYDTVRMERGSRHAHCEELLCTLTGAEAAIAVNNNAAAVLMVLSEFASGHDAVVSRGELIEIGGSFRIPDIMEQSNAHMIEVGTTNKTHPGDYARAIGPDTSLFLKVHTSNYRVVGFTESVEAVDLVRIAADVNAQRAAMGVRNPVLVYEDLGSGMLVRPPALDTCGEPTVSEAIGQGCDLVSFSGDKLLGGPQAGIIVGSKNLIDRLKRNPLARALRLDKLTIAALEATLRLYLNPDEALAKVPTLARLAPNQACLKARARTLANAIVEQTQGAVSACAAPSVARAGGGSLPLYDLPSWAVDVDLHGADVHTCAAYLTQDCPTPIIARVTEGILRFDVLTLMGPEEDAAIVEALRQFCATDTR